LSETKKFKITKDQGPFIFKLLIVAMAGIVILNFANIFYRPQEQNITGTPAKTEGAQEDYLSEDLILEKRLEGILGQISGVGNVSVSVVFAEGPTREYAVNVSTTAKEIEEKDQSGGVRTTTERTENGEMVMVEGRQQPVLVKESMPKIQGVLVVAQGAENPYVKEKLFKAVQTLLQVPAHRITIYSKNGG